ncbi:ankyrin repeat domain-containing protein [Hydrogenophaga sp.]|uniref:ankyrin repeat domain-containing protein n=1 Tax=Hydrogenophaga sp. TaxID=1904254 RepID=UPI00351D9FB1
MEHKHLQIAKLLVAQGASVTQPALDGDTPMHMACRSGHLDAVLWLLLASLGPDGTQSKAASVLNTSNQHGETPLQLAVQGGHANVVEFLLRQIGMDPNAPNQRGWSPLHMAARAGRIDILKLLLAHTDIKVRQEGPHRMNLLHSATLNKDPLPTIHLLRSFLPLEQFKSMVDAPDQWGTVAVAYAAERERSQEVLDALHPTHIPPPIQLPPTHQHRGWFITGNKTNFELDWMVANADEYNSTLHTYGTGNIDLNWEELKQCAIQPGDFVGCFFHARWDDDLQQMMIILSDGEEVPLVELARLLLERGVSRALFLCCKSIRAVKPLVNRFMADPTLPRPADSAKGYAGLEFTFVGEEEETLVTLNANAAALWVNDSVKPAGAEANAMRNSSVQSMKTVGCNKATGKIEVHYRPAMTLKNREHLGPASPFIINRMLLTHCFDGRLSEVEEILKMPEANPDGQFGDEVTPLAVACAAGHLPIVKALLKSGADIDLAPHDGRPPLLQACIAGREKVVKLLLGEGAESDCFDKFDYTPLHAACQHGHVAIVQMLLFTAEADITLQTKDGKNARSFAVQHGHHAIVKLLDDYVAWRIQ